MIGRKELIRREEKRLSSIYHRDIAKLLQKYNDIGFNIDIPCKKIMEIINLAQSGDEPLGTYLFRGEPASKYEYIEAMLIKFSTDAKREDELKKDLAKMKYGGIFGLFK